MAAEVRLTIAHGFSEGKVFVFRKRGTSMIGRADDCLIRLPDSVATADVSRRHCLLDIEPPHIRVRDLGSKNGTYVNGRNIGQRGPGVPAESASADTVGYGLEEGDELRVGGTTFRVSIPGQEGAARGPKPPTVSGGLLVC
jgi:pSer/pThr/pTyr-binding forkhead associated (FHA) protein